MSNHPRLLRVYDIARPAPMRVEIHEHDCDCAACAPYLQPAPVDEPALTLTEIGVRVWIGLAIGTAIAFAIDAHGAWLALTTVFTGGR